MNIVLIPRRARCASQKSKISHTAFTMLLCASAVALVVGTSSCSTTRGFGRDVQKAGQKIEKSAN